MVLKPQGKTKTYPKKKKKKKKKDKHNKTTTKQTKITRKTTQLNLLVSKQCMDGVP